MDYGIRETKRETDIVTMTKQEYDALNYIYKKGLEKRLTMLTGIDNINRMILTDGWHRLELIINVVDKNNKQEDIEKEI